MKTMIRAVGAITISLAIFILLVLNQPVGYIKPLVDISWPNCKNSQQFYSQAIIGVSGGLDYHSNKCLNQQVSQTTAYQLYINSGYPGTNVHTNLQNGPKACHSVGLLICRAFNYGYNSVLYDLNYANLNNAHSRIWWIDVETDNSWTNNILVNRAAILGQILALNQHNFLNIVGIYSDQTQWQQINGNWQNHLIVWLATGSTSRTVAKVACNSHSFSGGPIIYSQYTTSIDINYSCKSPKAVI